jgi:hypothetical protein
MTWHALTKPEIIARKATIEEIDALHAHHVRAFTAAKARLGWKAEPISKRRGVATCELLTRKLENLAEARRLWIEDFRKTENHKETDS